MQFQTIIWGFKQLQQLHIFIIVVFSFHLIFYLQTTI
jgi:hypothetical protein